MLANQIRVPPVTFGVQATDQDQAPVVVMFLFVNRQAGRAGGAKNIVGIGNTVTSEQQTEVESVAQRDIGAHTADCRSPVAQPVLVPDDGWMSPSAAANQQFFGQSRRCSPSVKFEQQGGGHHCKHTVDC